MVLSLKHVLFLFIFHGHDCQRRIQQGMVVNGDAPHAFVVYLMKAAISPRQYDSWLCGGAIVSEKYIVTSAACVMDVMHLYAIAGTNEYISDLDTNTCTKEMKKKIVFICTPTAYELVYEQQAKWSNIDIAVVQVESPYDFTAPSFGDCPYVPSKIDINYESKYQEAGIDAIVFGWGHKVSYRKETDIEDRDNQALLNYASALIENKEECKAGYEAYEGMATVIDKYMICTESNGNLNDKGLVIVQSELKAEGCEPQQSMVMKHKRVCGELPCENNGIAEDNNIVLVEITRKDIKPTNSSMNNADSNVVDSHNTHNSSLINKINETVLNSRRNGICQNDHGGPLVTWVGAHLKLIGVASAFKIDDNRKCTGPYLYTSTQCNGAFLDCIINMDDLTNDQDLRSRPKASNDNRRFGINCSSVLKEQGLKLVETHISWEDHPDGPAENEKNGTTAASAVSTQ